MTNLHVDIEPEEMKCWLESAVKYLQEYAIEHNEDVRPEVGTIAMILENIKL